MWAIIGTWPFALEGVELAAGFLQDGGDAIEAVVRAIEPAEKNPRVDSVGPGGLLNIEGELELDAGIMDGRTLAIGAVLALKGFPHPIRIARDVMAHCKHNVLAGEGAAQYAQGMGLTARDIRTPESIKKWEEALKQRQEGPLGHDTIGVCALSRESSMAVGVSTSGMGMKLPGRIGDSPLVGSGFYADNAVGAAAATGVGEDIMKGLLSFRAVEYMRAGLSPREAAEKAMVVSHNTLLTRGVMPGNMALVCLNRQGDFGGASNHPYFSFAVAREGEAPKVYRVNPVVQRVPGANETISVPPELAEWEVY